MSFVTDIAGLTRPLTFPITSPLTLPVTGAGRRGASFDRILSQLPDPADNNGVTVKLVGGAPTIYVKSDGVKWSNIFTGAEITPYWLPHGAKLHVNFGKGRFYWSDAVKTLSDLTVVVAGGYSLNYGFGYAGEMTVVLEYTASALPAVITNTLFSMTSGYPSGNRVEFVESNDSTYGDGIRLYVNPGNPTANYDAPSYASKLGELGGIWKGQERRRFIARIKNSTNHSYKLNNGQIVSGASGAGTLVTPTKLGFGNRAYAPTTPDNQVTGANPDSVTLYNVSVADNILHVMGRSDQYYPYHSLGDSGDNLYDNLEQLQALITAAYGYVASSQDSIGATTITQQEVRYTTTYPEFQDSTLISSEFGLDGTYAEWELAMNRILAALRARGHDRWIVMEPAPNTDDGTPQRIIYDAFVASIRTFCGGDVDSGGRFVPTLEAAMALSTGSAQDIAKVAARRWPTSLCISDIDFHPNHTAGAPFWGARKLYGLRARGWAPPAP